MSALVIHPTNPAIMYAGALGGGVFKSEDGAETWRPVGDALPNLQVASLALDPFNSETIYAGTGEVWGDGAGIFISTDAGASWSQLPATATGSDLFAPFQTVLRIGLSRTHQGRVYATAHDGLYRSTDAGETWTQVLSREQHPRVCTDLVVTSTVAADQVLAACGMHPAMVSRSTDGGETWATVLAPEGTGRIALAAAPSDPQLIYALASDSVGNYLGVHRSEDGGVTWQVVNHRDTDCQLGNLFSSNASSIAIAVDPLDPDRVWASGLFLFRSDDGGKTWAKFDDDLNLYRRAIAFPSDFDGVTADQIFVGGRNGIAQADARTPLDPYDCATGQGPIAGWTFRNNGFAAAHLKDGDVSADGSKILAATDGQGWAFGTLEQGVSAWRTQGATYPTGVALDPVNPARWIVESGSSILSTSDAGASFYHKTADLPGWVHFLGMDPNDPQVLWVGGDQLWRSSDQGETWTAASPFLDSPEFFSAIAVAPGNSDVVLAAHGSQIHRTGSALSAGDTGTEWISSTVEFMHPNNLVFDPTDSSVVYATVETMHPHLWKSLDGGATWASLDPEWWHYGLPWLLVYTLVVDPTNPSRLYVGTDAGLFTSVDGGIWAIDTSLPRTRINKLVIRTTAEGTFLFAFTGGRGVLRRMIAGPSGHPVSKKRRNGGGMPLWLLATMAALAAIRPVVERRVSGIR